MSLVKRPNEKKSSKGCWTCKSRKIGCDKATPRCNNCTRTNRACGGYGIKLHWPESGDGRRPIHPWDTDSRSLALAETYPGTPVPRGKYQFLNTTCEDLKIASGFEEQWYETWRFMERPQRSLKFGYEVTLGERDATLLSYYTEVLSRMITTIDDSLNGFRNYLLPNALADRYLSCLSLRYAILAVSAYHLWGAEAAVHYKISAIRTLSQSIQTGGGGRRGQFATCMMLCVGDVFDGADGSWPVHLKAARAIGQTMTRDHFLNTWLLYHDVLSDFSQGYPQGNSINPSPSPSASTSTSTSPSNIFLSVPSARPENKIIIGSLGCSLEILECISCINKLSGIPSRHIGAYKDIAQTLTTQLTHTRQIPAIMEDSTTGQIDRRKIENTAELYRLAALIYLHSILSIPSDAETIPDLVRKALDILGSNGVCTSPWPLFITALEVVGDGQRVRVLEVLGEMQSERRIGNLEIVRGIVELVWRQMDLRGGTGGVEGNGNGREVGRRIDWRGLVDMGRRIPSFI